MLFHILEEKYTYSNLFFSFIFVGVKSYSLTVQPCQNSFYEHNLANELYIFPLSGAGSIRTHPKFMGISWKWITDNRNQSNCMNLLAASLHEGRMGENWAKSNILKTRGTKKDQNKTMAECWLNSFRWHLLSNSGKTPFTKGRLHLL